MKVGIEERRRAVTQAFSEEPWLGVPEGVEIGARRTRSRS